MAVLKEPRHMLEGAATVYARVALGSAFLSAVADRFGVWGVAGARNVAWGDVGHFLTYTARITPFVPHPLVPAVGWDGDGPRGRRWPRADRRHRDARRGDCGRHLARAVRVRDDARHRCQNGIRRVGVFGLGRRVSSRVCVGLPARGGEHPDPSFGGAERHASPALAVDGVGGR